MDLNKGSYYDYVDNPFWSVMQVKVKQFAFKNPNTIVDQDKAKVILFCNMTLDSKYRQETEEQLNNLQRISDKYSVSEAKKEQFAVYSQFTDDLQGGEDLNNMEIAKELIRMGYLKKEVKPNSIRFLEKVSNFNNQLRGLKSSYLQV